MYEGAVGLSYARQMDQTRLGLQLKFIRQSIFTQNASGLAADLGLMRDISASLRFGGYGAQLGPHEPPRSTGDGPALRNSS